MKSVFCFVEGFPAMVRKQIRILCVGLFFVATFVTAAHAENVFVNPGTVGGNAQDFWFEVGPAAHVDILWSDNKTLEYTSGTHLFFLFGPPCDNYAGTLLDAAGNPIPDTEIVGSTLCTAGSDLSAGVIDLPAATVFSGIRLISSGFGENYAWQWTWEEDEKPVVGQIEAEGNQPPVPDAGGPYEGRATIALTFDASASIDPDGTIVTHNWDFGDDTSLGGETVTHTYTNGGRYNVTLTVTDNEGAIQSTSTIADIGNNSLRPTADDGGPYTGEVLVNVQFDGTGSTDDGSITQYTWDFGDGTAPISGTATPLKSYAAAGTYFVELTVADDTGNKDATVTTATITGDSQAPVADAGQPVEGVVGTAVSFEGGGSSDDVGIASYDWDFGDGNNGTGVNPSHTYTTSGDYTVILTVTDGDGFQDSANTAASIDANPLPPRADAGPPAEGTAGIAISFDASGSDDPDGGNIETYTWDFGDGNSGTGVNPSHTYAAADNYTVTLTVTDDDGLSDTDTTQAAIDQANSPPTSDAGGPYAGIVNQPVILDGSAATDGDGDIVQYDWDFDDGNTGSGLYVPHTYTASGTYEVTLTVTDDSGDSDDSNAVVIVGGGALQPPRVFTNGPYNGVAGVPLTVDGSNSSDPDGTINLYEWSFGDGNSSTGDVTSNNYKAGDLYRLILHVTDDDGFTASDSTVARIGDLSVPPVAVANVNNEAYVGRVNVPVSFNGSNSTDSDGNIVRYDWEFGDGTTANDAVATPSHSYEASGLYFLKLSVTDDSGETDTTVTEVTIGTGNLPPTAIAGDAISGTAGLAVSFNGTESNDPDGTIDNYVWNFGDGKSESGKDLAITTHVYDEPGIYFVTLSISDDNGTISSDVTVANIYTGISSPILTTPANGSVVPLGPDGSTTLKWKPASDPDGGDVSYTLYLCDDEDPLTNCLAEPIAAYGAPGNGAGLYASMAPVVNSDESTRQIVALLVLITCIGLAGYCWSTRKRTLAWIWLTLSMAVFIGCSDGDKSDFTSAAAEVTYVATGLSTDTTYYWAVLAKDDQGEESSSEVWNFTTE